VLIEYFALVQQGDETIEAQKDILKVRYIGASAMYA
jgi:hypothetical protein